MARIRTLLTPITVLALLLSAAAILLPAGQALAADYWSISITADAGSDGTNAPLEFGTRLSATDSFDSGGIDLPTAPPAPSATFRCYFQITDTLFSQLNNDYRELLPSAPGSSIIWSLNIQSTSQPIHLNWSDTADAGVPADVSLVLSGGGQTINMRTTSSAAYASGTHALTITASRPATPNPDDEDDSGDDSPAEDTGDDTDDNTNHNTTNNTGDDTSPDIEPNEGVPGQDGSVDNINLSITPGQVLPNEEVTVSANICNSGDGRATRTVSLMVNGAAEQSQSIDLSAGACQQVIFRVSRPVPGTYQVTIEGMTGQFSVLTPTTVTTGVPSTKPAGLSTTTLIAIIAVVAVLIVAIIMVFRRM